MIHLRKNPARRPALLLLLSALMLLSTPAAESRARHGKRTASHQTQRSRKRPVVRHARRASAKKGRHAVRSKARKATGVRRTAARKSTRTGGLRGVASWYGPGFHGRRTATGERFNMNALTAAHRTLPLGSRVRVLNV